MTWIPSRTAGLEKLRSFLPRAARYASERNYDFGPASHTNVSQLSPYLRHRLVTEEEVWAATLSQYKFTTVEKFLQEVIWRTYWKGWLEQRPTVWEGWMETLPRIHKTPMLENAKSGQTGIAPFDHWVNELRERNYLHNHARMWFASIWIFTLNLPWEAGADFFMKHLIDGDAASNTLGWRWVAGIQTPGKHYLARRENIVQYTQGRLDPGDTLNETAAPISETMNPVKITPDYPIPVAADPPRPGDALFVTSDDCAPDTFFADRVFSAIAGGRPETSEVGGPTEAPAVRTFRDRAVLTTLERLKDSEGRPGKWIDSHDVQNVVQWAEDEKLKRVWIAKPPVGPTKGPISKLLQKLEPSNISIRWFGRSWDRHLYPFAKAGFFRFRKAGFSVARELISKASK